jgi:NADPH:quinone reductase-like Zn-dependent oxidoreductase
MKAMVYTTYGRPDVVKLQEVTSPIPAAGEVLVRIRAALVTPSDVVSRAGTPYFARLYFGLTKPKFPVLGSEFAGEIAAVGPGVTRFQVGDEVFGGDKTLGAHAEYLCVAEGGAIALKPASLGFEESVAVIDGAMTALPFLRDSARLRRGQGILINGASGAVGVAAVQLAKHIGATVTAVCSTSNRELVASLGADAVIDYTTEDFTRGGRQYDVIFDAVGKRSFAKCRRALAAGGIYLTTVPSPAILLAKAWTARFGKRRAGIAFTGLRDPAEKADDLAFLTALVEAGSLVPVIDRRYPLEQIALAHEYVDTGRKRGSVVITVS